MKVQCEIYSRVAGYYRPTSQWNLGKQEEFKDRQPYASPENKMIDKKKQVA
jgi:anaerobic ribonucleoside-triphosphate reductase